MKIHFVLIPKVISDIPGKKQLCLGINATKTIKIRKIRICQQFIINIYKNFCELFYCAATIRTRM